jgi:hypothetical protein
MFNWRMIFPFEYMDAEKLLVAKKKVQCDFFCADCRRSHFVQCVRVGVMRVKPRGQTKMRDNESFNSRSGLTGDRNAATFELLDNLANHCLSCLSFY